MSLVYSVFPSEEHIRIVARGRVTAANGIDLIRRVVKDRLSKPHFSVLVDLRAAAFDPSGPVPGFESELEELLPDWEGNIAVVAKGALLFTAVLLSTHVRAAVQTLSIKVFGDCASAESFCMKGRLASLALTPNRSSP